MNSDDDLDLFRVQLGNLFAEMTDVLVSKRLSYGTTNLTRFGGIGIVIRASDKIDRLATMYRAGETASADGDSMRDAWLDLIGYGALGLLHHEED